MGSFHVCENPHEELTGEQLGGIAETFIKAIFIKQGHIPKKLCKYNNEMKRQELIVSNANYVINNSNLESNKKQQLTNYLKQNILGLPDFIVLTSDKNITFTEVKYNISGLSAYPPLGLKPEQQKRKEELEAMGFNVSVERVGKILPSPQKPPSYFERILSKLMFWRKPKLVTTHEIG